MKIFITFVRLLHFNLSLIFNSYLMNTQTNIGGQKSGFRISLLQMDIVWGDPEANAVTAMKAIDANPGSDLYVLPEMWSTGFATEPKNIAEKDLHSLNWMAHTARQKGVALAGSIATELTDGDFRNRFYFVKPTGDVVYYDKHHLFTYGGEDKRYTAGNQRTVVEYGGIRFLLLVCYDLRFPIWSRSHEDYDCILYVASWPTSRIDAWRTLLKARAIENQCYVAGVNRVGTDPACQYCGGTMLVDPYGKVVTECDDNKEMVITAELDTTLLQNFRKKFPVLKDRD